MKQRAIAEHGIETLEFIGFFPFFLMAGLIAGQLLVAGHAMLTTTEAARQGARALAGGTNVSEAVSVAAMPYQLADLRVSGCDAGEPGKVTVGVNIPFLTIPLTSLGEDVVTSATAFFRCEPRF